jgi:hypothetical protein
MADAEALLAEENAGSEAYHKQAMAILRRVQSSPDFGKFTPRSRKDVLVHRGDFARQYLLAATARLIWTRAALR